MKVYHVQVQLFRTVDGKFYTHFDEHCVGIYATPDGALTAGRKFAANIIKKRMAADPEQCEDIHGQIRIEETNPLFLEKKQLLTEDSAGQDTTDRSFPRPGQLAGISPDMATYTYTLDGTLLCRDVQFGNRCFEMYPEDELPEAGLKYRTGDIVKDTRTHMKSFGKPLVVQEAPRCDELPWHKKYFLLEIDDSGSLCSHLTHEHWLAPYAGSVTEPMRYLSRLLRQEFPAEDYVWNLLKENKIDFSTDRINWHDLFRSDNLSQNGDEVCDD